MILMKINEREAYRRFHAEERLKAQWSRALRRISADIESIAAGLAVAKARQDVETRESQTRELVERMFHDKAFNRTLRAFSGHTPQGWRVACGCDGRMKRLLQDPGWPVLEEAIRRIRIAKGMVRGPCRRETWAVPDATRALKAKLGYGG